MELPYTNQLLYIKRNVINVLLRNSYSEPFKIPVNPEALHVPQYPKLIKCPMDLGTIKMKLDKQIYQTANECKNDFLDIFRNCYIFNEPGSLYVEMALKLENLFKRKMADLPVPEHYGIDTAFHTPKTNRVKKRKSIKLHNNNAKPSVVLNGGSGTPIAQMGKSAVSSQKRSRSEAGNLLIREEPPSAKKTKFGIDLKACKHIILSLISKKYNNINRYFLEPVDVEGLKLHDYFDVVKKPMDLGTVKRKLSDGCYQTNEQFGDDVRQIFRNCYLYNPEGHEVNRCGKLLEAVFLELYHNAFSNNVTKKTPLSSSLSSSQAMAPPNCDDLQPLLQKILKRQSEIDSMHEYIIKQNREIQQSIDHLNASDLIKLFKATVHQNHMSQSIVGMTEQIAKKPPLSTSTLVGYESSSSSSKTFSPKQSLMKSKSSGSKTIDNFTKTQSNQSLKLLESRSVMSKSPKSGLVQKPDAGKTSDHHRSMDTTTKRSIKQPKSQSNEEPFKTSSADISSSISASSSSSNSSSAIVSSLNKTITGSTLLVAATAFSSTTSSVAGGTSIPKRTLNHINNNSTIGNSNTSHLLPPPPSQHHSQSRESMSTNFSDSTMTMDYSKTMVKSTGTGVGTGTSPNEISKSTKNKEAFNARLKEIKTWIGSLSVEMGMKVREFINKSENQNVVSVSLLKLKPATLNGLYKMMSEPTPSPLIQQRDQVMTTAIATGQGGSSKPALRQFTIEDRMQLSQDLRQLGEKCSEKILNIYKKTEDVQSLDGECEIDFHTMKLVTLHSLREFADRYLEKKRERLLKKGALSTSATATGQPVGNNDGDSDSHSSDSSDSDASDSNSDASSSSDNEFFNNLMKSSAPTATSTTTTTTINSSTITIEPSCQTVSASVSNEIPAESIKPFIEAQPLNQLNQSERFVASTNNTNGESRLTDSSDSSDKEEDDDKKDNTPKRPIYKALWNKSSSADNKTNLINNSSLKPKSLSIPHPMYSNTNTKQLSEGLRQIVQNAQALENVKKQEEELRMVRLKQDEEQKMQHILKMQALNETRKQQHFSENLKREEDMIRMKELSINDSKQRALDIPCIPEREDYHQILCDFEYNINPDLIRKLVELDQSQILF